MRTWGSVATWESLLPDGQETAEEGSSNLEQDQQPMWLPATGMCSWTT